MKMLLLCSLVGVLIACNGNGSPVDPPDKTPPTLISTSPITNATGVDLQSPITAAFSENLDPSTLGANVNLKQIGSHQNISISPNLNADTITIGHPALSLRTSYQASLGNNLKDLAGNAFAGATWNFTTRDGVWHDNQQIDNPDLSASTPQLAMAADGSATAVWVSFPGATSAYLWANHYTPATGWGTPQQIETQTPKYRSGARVAVDDFGNAIAVWDQSEAVAGRHDIVASRYTPANGWSVPEAIETEEVRTAVNPVIAMNSSGSAVAAWAQNDGTRANVWANVYAPGAGWGTPKLIEANDTGNANQPQIAIDSGGNAHVVWIQDAGTVKPSIWGNLYRASGGWDVAFPLELESAAATNPHLGINANGNAVVVWDQSEETFIPPNKTVGYWHVWHSMYTPETGWSAAGRIPALNSDTGYAGQAQVGLDAKGNAIAVWLQQNPTKQTFYDVWSNRFKFGQGWETPTPLEPGLVNNDIAPQVAVDPAGNAIAVWTHDTGALQFNRYLADSGWLTAKGLQPSNPQNTVLPPPQLAMDSAGNALAVYLQFGPHVWASEFR